MLDRNAKQALSFVVCVLFAALSCGQLFAQMSVTGAVSGTVMDASGAVAPGATVKLTSETTKQAHETKSDGEGLFSFTAVPRDTYTLKIERTGFKAIERTGIAVSANEHVALPCYFGEYTVSKHCSRPMLGLSNLACTALNAAGPVNCLAVKPNALRWHAGLSRDRKSYSLTNRRVPWTLWRVSTSWS